MSEFFREVINNFSIIKNVIDAEQPPSAIKSKIEEEPSSIGNPKKDLEILRWLYDEKGVSPTILDNDGLTILHWAASRGLLEIVKWLVDEKGINPDIQNFSYELDFVIPGPTPLQVAIAGGHLDVVRWLIDVKNVQLYTEKEPTESEISSFGFEWNDQDMLYLNESYDPHVLIGVPLLVAVARGYFDLVKWLVDEKGVPPDIEAKSGWTPLHLAVFLRRLDIVKWLVHIKGVSPDIQNLYGITARDIAVKDGKLDMLKCIIGEKCLSTDIKNFFGNIGNLLADSVSRGHLEICKWLVNEKSVPLGINIELYGPWEFITYDKKTEDTDYYVRSSSVDDGRPLLGEAIHEGHLDIVKWLIDEKGVSTDLGEKNGRMALHLAAADGHFDIVKWLVNEKGVNPCIEDAKGRMPLHYAASGGYFDIIKWLVDEKGVNPCIKDEKGRTPLHLATSGEHRDIVRWLVDIKHVSTNIKDEKGRTPLDEAAESEQSDVVKWRCDVNSTPPISMDKSEQMNLDSAYTNSMTPDLDEPVF